MIEIPKIIHYCWFGGGKKPDKIKRYMKTWDILNDYEIKEWNENNSNLHENKYLQEVYDKKKWAFVSDYIRLKALYEHGGIYLDTDVEVFQNFNDLLGHKMFLGFIYDCSIGTAVIGAVPKHPVVKELLELYNDIIYCDESYLGYTVPKLSNKKLMTNNDLFTLFFLNKYPDFRLNNKYQELDDLVLYPKEYFELQPIYGKHYSVHRCTSSWINNQSPDIRQSVNYKLAIKNTLLKIPFINVEALIDHINYKRKLPKLPFYSYYLEHKGN